MTGTGAGGAEACPDGARRQMLANGWAGATRWIGTGWQVLANGWTGVTRWMGAGSRMLANGWAGLTQPFGEELQSGASGASRQALRLAVLLSGAGGMIGQLVLIRVLVIVAFGNELILGLILSVWLLSETAGAWTGGRLAAWRTRRDLFCALLLLYAVTLPAMVVLARYAGSGVFGRLPGAAPDMRTLAGTLLLTLVPAALVHGMLFPLCAQLMGEDGRDGSVSRAYLLEMTGAIGGGLVFVGVLAPRFQALQVAIGLLILHLLLGAWLVRGRREAEPGTESGATKHGPGDPAYGSADATATGSAGDPVSHPAVDSAYDLAVDPSSPPVGDGLRNQRTAERRSEIPQSAPAPAPAPVPCGRGRRVLTGVLLAAAVVLVSVFGDMTRWLHRYSVTSMWPYGELAGYRNSPYGNIAILERQDEYTVLYDGRPIMTLPHPDLARLQDFAFWPALAHPRPDSVLVLGGALGGLLSSMLQQPLQALVYTELDPELPDMLQALDSAVIRREMDDPRTVVERVDGRLFLHRTRQRFDLIVVGDIDLQTLQANRLFTLEFFHLARRRLRPGGILALSLPGSMTYLGEALASLNACVLQTMDTVFAETVLIPGDTHILLASDAPIDLRPQTVMQRLRARGLGTSVTPYGDTRAERLHARGLGGGTGGGKEAGGEPGAGTGDGTDVETGNGAEVGRVEVIEADGGSGEGVVTGGAATPREDDDRKRGKTATDGTAHRRVGPGGAADNRPGAGMFTEAYVAYRLDPARMEATRDLLAGTAVRLNRDFQPAGFLYGLRYWAEALAPGILRAGNWWRALPRSAYVGTGLVLIVLAGWLLAVSPGAWANRLTWTVGSSGWAAMSFEIIALFAFQSLYGIIYQLNGLFIVAFMGGMLAGGRMSHRRIARRPDGDAGAAGDRVAAGASTGGDGIAGSATPAGTSTDGATSDGGGTSGATSTGRLRRDESVAPGGEPAAWSGHGQRAGRAGRDERDDRDKRDDRSEWADQGERGERGDWALLLGLDVAMVLLLFGFMGMLAGVEARLGAPVQVPELASTVGTAPGQSALGGMIHGGTEPRGTALGGMTPGGMEPRGTALGGMTPHLAWAVLAVAGAALAGGLTGAQFPLAATLMPATWRARPGRLASRLYAADLLGGCAGGIGATVLLLTVPRMDAMLMLVAALKGVSLVFLGVSKPR